MAKPKEENLLINKRPDLIKEWDFAKNTDIDINTIGFGSKKKVWWIGKCGHSWDAVVSNRARHNRDCPYCSNQKVLIGYNDMWTTNPKLAEQLFNPEDGYKYMQSSNLKTNWKCSLCDNVIYNKIISNVKKQGLSCPSCSDGKSYAEKVVFNALKQSIENVQTEISFTWSKGRRYDFYLPELKCIIEVHGKQHYEEHFVFNNEGGATLSERQRIDLLKLELAKSNGILHYISINAYNTDFNNLKNEITNSDLKNLLDLNAISWNRVELDSEQSILYKIIEKWNVGERNLQKLSKSYGISIFTVKKYLRKGNRNNLCKYPLKSREELATLSRARKVVQLDLNNNFIKQWDVISHVERELGIHQSSIGSCCKGKVQTAGGFKWMYLEEYNKEKEIVTCN